MEGAEHAVLHVLIILMFMVIVLHDGAGGAGASGAGDGGVEVWVSSLGPMAVLGAATWVVLATLARDVQRRGSWRSVRRAERVLGWSRVGAVLLHAANVLAVGLLDRVRLEIGDLVAVDELVVIAPPIGVFLVGWWAFEPIERTLRDATTIRLLDSGRPVFAAPTRWQYVVLQLRHQVLLSLVPIGMIAVWSESVQAGLRWLRAQPGVPGMVGWSAGLVRGDAAASWAHSVLQLVGVVVVFAVSPLVLRRVWDTVRVAPGPLRTRLAAICARSGVRVRDLLVWRTHGTMINGAVIGLVAPLRYILLTDALLENLSGRQVEAVMAHEVGHARHRHMPWLTVSMLVGVTGAATILSVGVWAVLRIAAAMGHAPLARAIDGSYAGEAVVTGASLLLGLGWFGFVSRRFEWQADAFAVQQLTRVPAESPYYEEGSADVPPPERVSVEAVAAMTGALQAVADLNHLSRQRKSWRHGSIAYRQNRLRQMTGQPLERLRIDRVVRGLKIVLALGLAVMVGAAAWSALAG